MAREELIIDLEAQGGNTVASVLERLERGIRELIIPIESLSRELRQVSNVFNEFQSETRQTDTDLNQMQNEMRQTDNILELLRNGMIQNINIFNNFQTEINQTENRLNNFHGGMNRVGGGISNVSGLLGKFGGVIGTVASTVSSLFIFQTVTDMFYRLADGIKEAMFAGIKYNQSMEDNVMAFTTLLGSQEKAQALMNDLTEMAKKTPFETSDLVQAQKMMMGFGVEANDAKKYMTMLGDLSLGNSQYFGQASLAFSQIFAAGKMQGQDALQLINAGIPIWQLLEKTTGRTTAQLKKDMEDGKLSIDMIIKAMQAATSEGGKWYKGMENASSTFSGRLSTLKDEFNIFMGQAMKPVFDFLSQTAMPIASMLIGKFRDIGRVLKKEAGPIIDELKEKWKELFGDTSFSLSGFMDKVTASVPGILDTFMNIFGGIIDLIIEFRDTFQDGGSVIDLAGTKIRDAIVSLFPKDMQKDMSFFLTKAYEIWSWMGNSFEQLRRIIPPIVAAVVGAFKGIDFGNTWTTLMDTFKTLQPLAELITKTIGALGLLLLGLLTGVLAGVIQAIPRLIQSISGLISFVVNFIAILFDLISLDFSALEVHWKRMCDGIYGFAVGLIGSVVELFKGFVDGIINYFTTLYDTLVGHSIVPDLVNAIIQWFNNLWNWGVSVISGFINSVIGYFQNLWSRANQTFWNIVNSIGSILGSLWGVVSSAFSNVTNAIYSRASEAWNAARSVANNILNAVASIGSSLYQSGRNIIQSVIDGIYSMLGGVKSAAKSIASTIKSFFPSSPAKEGPLKTIPKWMPTMIGMMTDGIYDGIDKIKNASQYLANAVSPEPYLSVQNPIPLEGMGKSVTIVNNNNVGSNVDVNTMMNKVVSQLKRHNVIPSKA